MLLRELQALLARIYGLQIDADVADYLITDPEYLKQLLGKRAVGVEESLLIVQEEDFLDVGLYLDEGMLERVTQSDPCGGFGEHQLDEFCKVLEGVSHFVYLAWNAAKDKRITRLELEMQAEVDKYISSRLLLDVQSGHAADLLAALFERVAYDPKLRPRLRERYRQANDAACRYCYNLEQRFSPTGIAPDMLEELRAFYRMPQPDKLSHINTAQFA